MRLVGKKASQRAPCLMSARCDMKGEKIGVRSSRYKCGSGHA